MNKNFAEDAAAAKAALSSLKTEWDGRECILELQANDFNWRQMEWIGWFFEMKCRQLLPSAGFEVPGERIGRITFDAKRLANWDFKAHAVKSNSHFAVLNDVAAMDASIAAHGWHGLIVALCDCDYNDTDRAFQRWHTNLKGGLSIYERERLKRTSVSRYRKTRALLSEILFISIDERSREHLRIYAQGRNSNGNPREPKYMIDLENLDAFQEIRWPESGTLSPDAAPATDPTAD